jgi:hypothetical protein
LLRPSPEVFFAAGAGAPPFPFAINTYLIS